MVETGKRAGPVVVPAHGFGCDQNLWRLVVPVLARDHRGGAVRSHRRRACRGRGVGPGSLRHARRLAVTGHCPQLSTPEVTAEAILSFTADLR